MICEDAAAEFATRLPKQLPEPDPPIGGCNKCGCAIYDRPAAN
jgi:hypothetical protein